MQTAPRTEVESRSINVMVPATRLTRAFSVHARLQNGPCIVLQVWDDARGYFYGRCWSLFRNVKTGKRTWAAHVDLGA